MDDGYSYGNKTMICTECYDKRDLEILIDGFREHLNINATLMAYRIGYRTLVDVRNLFKIKNYICESMLYKISNQKASEAVYTKLNKINLYKYIIKSNHDEKLCEAIDQERLFCNICNAIRAITHAIYNQHLRKDICVMCGVLYEPYSQHNCQKYNTRCIYCKIWLGSNRAIQEHESRHLNKMEIINNQFTIYEI